VAFGLAYRQRRRFARLGFREGHERGTGLAVGRAMIVTAVRFGAVADWLYSAVFLAVDSWGLQKANGLCINMVVGVFPVGAQK
jgi:hypothetical protein